MVQRTLFWKIYPQGHDPFIVFTYGHTRWGRLCYMAMLSDDLSVRRTRKVLWGREPYDYLDYA